jgi:PAS domain S-box-containing protein
MSPKKKKTASPPTTLRQQAEEQVSKSQRPISQMSPEEVKRLVHELQVHQVELQMQNEQLRETQVALEETRDRYAALFDFSPIGYLLLNEEGRIQEVNLRFCQLVGSTRKNLLHQSFIQLVEPEDQSAFRRHLNTLPENGLPHLSEVLSIRCAEIPCRVRLESCRDFLPHAPQRSGIRIAVLNMKEQEQAQEALRKSHEELERRKTELQSLTEQLFRAQEEERERISRELHDDICQRLAILQMQLQKALPPQSGRQKQEIMDNLVNISNDLRQLSHRYHPSILYDLGLEMALHALATNFRKSLQLPIELSISQVPRQLSGDIMTCIYRVSQESLQNIAKHARATVIQCDLKGGGCRTETDNSG